MLKDNMIEAALITGAFLITVVIIAGFVAICSTGNPWFFVPAGILLLYGLVLALVSLMDA